MLCLQQLQALTTLRPLLNCYRVPQLAQKATRPITDTLTVQYRGDVVDPGPVLVTEGARAIGEKSDVASVPIRMCFPCNTAPNSPAIPPNSLVIFNKACQSDKACQSVPGFTSGEGQMLRLPKIPVSVVCSVALLMAQMPPGFAQNAVSTPAQPAAFGPAQDVTPSTGIVDAFKAFPKGGDLLSKRIEDIIVADPKLAPDLAKYVQTAPDLNKEQKQAAFRGLAAALNRLGIKAAELPLPAKEPAYVAPPPEVYPGAALLALLALGGLICVLACHEEHAGPVSP